MRGNADPGSSDQRRQALTVVDPMPSRGGGDAGRGPAELGGRVGAARCTRSTYSAELVKIAAIFGFVRHPGRRGLVQGAAGDRGVGQDVVEAALDARDGAAL